MGDTTISSIVPGTIANSSSPQRRVPKKTTKSKPKKPSEAVLVKRQEKVQESQDLTFIKKCIESKRQLKIIVKVPCGAKTKVSEKREEEMNQVSDMAENKEETKEQPANDGYPCSEEGCSAVLRTTTALRKHKLVHAPKQFACKECTRTFAELTKLRRHMLTHTGEKKFKCEFEGCGRNFALESNLKAHKRIHTGEKSHVCSHCGHGFAHSYNLKVHVFRRHPAT